MKKAVRLLAILGIAAAAMTAALAQEPESDAVAQQRVNAGVMAWMRSIFVLPPDIEIDADLRKPLESMAAEHLARMTPIVAAWVAEEAVIVPRTPTFGAILQRHVSARHMNEIALWRLESPGAEYDAVLIPALLRPGHCRARDHRPYFAQVALLLQDVPPDKRPAMLSVERALLAKWGQPRANLTRRPAPSLRDWEAGVIATMREGKEPPGPAPPPVVASRILVDDARDGDLSVGVLCALHQWGLAQALAAQVSTKEATLSAYRYAMAPNASEWLTVSESDAALAKAVPPADYPFFALKYEIEGTVALRVAVDAQGRFKRATVARRDIRVPGVPGRPIAFETQIDDASIARAKLGSYPVPDPATVKNGEAIVEQPFAWKIE